MAAGTTSCPMPSPGITAIRYVLISRSASSPQADHLPPEETNRQPDRQMDQRHEESDPPPLRLRQVARSEDDGRGARAVVRCRRIEAREDPECHARQERRRAKSNDRREEGREHRRDVRDETRERVMRIDIDDEQRDERPPPGPALDESGGRMRE